MKLCQCQRLFEWGSTVSIFTFKNMQISEEISLKIHKFLLKVFVVVVVAPEF